MLADDVYDAFVLVPLYMGMYHKQNIHIHGCVSKKLYKNVMTYLQRILCDFSDDLSRIDIQADGFKIAEGEPHIIGAGLSCGVDSLSTIYDHYVQENDPDYRINGLFFFECGTNGELNESSRRLWLNRYELNKGAAEELGLPLYLVDSNFRNFTTQFETGGNARVGYFSVWSCILGLQKAVKKYYVASSCSYEKLLTFGKYYRNGDFADFSEAYSLPLVQTERIELVIDGCQYERTQKTERISDWDIAHKYLNPCQCYADIKEDAHNCSKCSKCLRTLTPIDALGKLEKFSGVFDPETYRRYSFYNKCDIVVFRHKKAYHEDNYTFGKKHGMKFPPYIVARLYMFSIRALRRLKKMLKH